MSNDLLERPLGWTISSTQHSKQNRMSLHRAVLAFFIAFIVGANAQDEAAALIIGGFNNGNILATVELFGCPGQTESKLLGDFPLNVYLNDGKYVNGQVPLLLDEDVAASLLKS